MLLSLRLSNFAVIEEAEVAFGPGLTVLTGETGAGKSMLIDALALNSVEAAELVRMGELGCSYEHFHQHDPGGGLIGHFSVKYAYCARIAGANSY